MSTHSDLRNAETAVILTANALVLADNYTVATNNRRQNVSRERFVDLAKACLELERRRQDLDGDAPHNKTQTSKLASKLPGKGSLRRQVLNVVLVRFSATNDGITTQEIELRLQRKHESVSSAVNYLKNHGLIEDTGTRRKNATVYTPTELARSLARQNLLVAP